MADGFEGDRTEAYFSGRLHPHPLPRRIKPEEANAKGDADKGARPQEG